MSTPSGATQTLITPNDHTAKDRKSGLDYVSSMVTPAAAASMAAVGRAGQVSVLSGGQEQIVGVKGNQWCFRVYPKPFFALDSDPQHLSRQSAFYFASISLSNTAITFLSLDDNVLTIFFAKEDSNFEPGFYIGDRRDFISHFLGAYPFCQELQDYGPINKGLQDRTNGKGKARFDHYSATIAKLTFSYHRAEVIEAFLNDLKMRYAVPLDIVENIKKHIVPKKETDEELEFYKDVKALKFSKEKEKNKLPAKEFESRAIVLNIQFQRRAENIKDSQLKSNNDVLYCLAKKGLEVNARSWAYSIFSLIEKESIYYRLARFEMGQLFFNAWKPKLKDPKYHARAVCNLLLSTPAGFEFGLKNLVPKELEHPELTGYMKEIKTSFEEAIIREQRKELQALAAVAEFEEAIKHKQNKEPQSVAAIAAIAARSNLDMKIILEKPRFLQEKQLQEMKQFAVDCTEKIKFLASFWVEKPQACAASANSASALAPAPILTAAAAAAKASMTGSLSSVDSAVSVASVDSGAASTLKAPAQTAPFSPKH
jgi:hypothetical protein